MAPVRARESGLQVQYGIAQRLDPPARQVGEASAVQRSS